MTKRERVLAAVHGEQPDRIPVAFWRHWPGADLTAEGLADAVVAWQQAYDWDLVKVTPASGYAVEDWGVGFVDKGNREGTREYTKRVIRQPRDWETLWPLDVTVGVLGRQLQALRLIRARLGPDIHIFQTFFSPLSLARNLAGDATFFRHLREHPDHLRRGLAVISDTHARFAQECLRAGADGVFFASQLASRDLLSEDEYEEFGVPYDRHVLGAAAGDAELILLHIHGLSIMFSLLAHAYPVHILNWHDRRTAPNLADARLRTHLALMGGINEWQTLAPGQPDQVEAEVRDAVQQTGGRGYLVGAGCVIPIDVPDANLRAVRSALS